MTPGPDRPTWLRSDRLLARRVARPIQRFLQVEAAGGILLLAAAVVALVWANSPWSSGYADLWGTELTLDVGLHRISEDLRHWINDGLMTLFFFVIGLEIKQELTSGQLAARRDAVVPAAAALGGMAVPALLYVALNVGGDGLPGWGIPMATDVAFALGVLSMLGRRVPSELKVLLLGLAIVDDIGAIVVIALFYSGGLDLPWALAAVGGLLLVALAKRVKVRFLPVYVALGVGIWLATFESGVHATIAGVALGLLAPARAPVTERLQARLHPWTSYVIVPLFALANAGVVLSSDIVGDAARSAVAQGIVVGLVVGKFVGVAGAVLLVTRLGIGRIPPTITTRHVLGMAAIAGIGFTVSIFIAGLAFDDAASTDEAKLGVLLASVLAAVLGAAILGAAPAAEQPSPD